MLLIFYKKKRPPNIGPRQKAKGEKEKKKKQPQ